MNLIFKKIQRMAEYGKPTHGNPALFSWHAISNQVWLWNIALTASIVPLIAVLFFVFGNLLGEERWRYLISYAGVPVGVLAVQVLLFWWGNSSRYRTLALHLLILSNCVMLWLFSFGSGAGTRVYFILPTIAALPFYFFRRDIHATAWRTKILWCLGILVQFVIAIFYLQRVNGWLPIPQPITAVIGQVILGLAALIIVTYAGYFWWQLGVTRRIYLVWEEFSVIGLNGTENSMVRKQEILINRMVVLAALAYGGLTQGLMLVIGVVAIVREEYEVLWLGLWYAPPCIIIPSLSQLYFFLKRRGIIRPQYQRNNFFVELAYSAISYTGNFYIALLLPFNVYYIVYSSLYFMILTIFKTSNLLDRILRFMLFLYFVAGTLIVIWWHTKYAPLGMPPEWSIWFARFTSVLFFGLILMWITFYLRLESERSEGALTVAHAESEKLLLNILPAEVSHELKAQGHTTPREYPSATVLFTDFVGFTRIAEKLTAVDLVRELDQCFSYFDNVAQKYGLEKLKTIGDAYMAAGGIPVENNTHPIDCALAALEIQAFMNQMKNIKEQQGLPYWELRLGMHTGPLVAGVVGEKKFAYDVWGDTVNTASRMESSGEPGAINISRELYDRLQFLFACEYRGKVYAKNKGEIEMYFLRGLKPKFSIHGEGRVPNEEFKAVYAKVKAGARLVKKQSRGNSETV